MNSMSMLLFVCYILQCCGLIKNSKNIKVLPCKLTSDIIEYQNDWSSGEVPWEFVEKDIIVVNSRILFDSGDRNVDRNTDRNVDRNTDRNVDRNNDIKHIIEKNNVLFNPSYEQKIISKAITSGIMKGIYVQIMSIDNVITYMQCYTNKVIDFDIALSLLYIIVYEKVKSNEKQNIITLKHYNNIQLFNNYITVRRNSMIIIIIIYILFFRGISNVE